MLLKKSQSTAQPKSVIENSMEWINKDNASAISSENVNDKSLNNESKGAPLSCIKNIDHFFIYLFLISLVFTLGFIAGWFSMNHSFRFPVLKPSRKNVKISEEHQQYQIVTEDPQILLARIRDQIRFFQDEKEKVMRVDKEDLVHYNLLKQRGYEDSSPECHKILERQRKNKGYITKLNSTIKEALDLKQKLIEAINRTNPDGKRIELDHQLRSNVRRYLNKLDLEKQKSIIIPDDFLD